jgi:hypothetical protein
MPGTKIYALLDPGRHVNRNSRYRRGAIRYIGQAQRPMGRLKTHWRDSIKNPGSAKWKRPVYKWMRTLSEPPVMLILAVVEPGDGGDVEDGYIEWAWHKWGWNQILNRYINGHLVSVGEDWYARLGEVWDRPGYRENQSAKQTVLWADPEHRAMVMEARVGAYTDEARAKMSAAARASWDKPEYRANQSARTKARWTPEFRARRSAQVKEQMSDPEAKARASERMKANHDDPEFDAKRRASLQTPEYRAKRSASAKEQMSRPGHRAKLSASAHRRWERGDAKSRQAVSDSNKRRHALARQADPEAYRAKQSAAANARWARARWNSLCSLDKPCKECCAPVGVFALDCETCQRRKHHPFWQENWHRYFWIDEQT